MKYNRPAHWYIVCYLRSDSDFETLSRFGVVAISTGSPFFDLHEWAPFDIGRDKVFQLEDDFNWKQVKNVQHRNSELFRQWGNLVQLGWKPHITSIQYLSLDLIRMISSN